MIIYIYILYYKKNNIYIYIYIYIESVYVHMVLPRHATSLACFSLAEIQGCGSLHQSPHSQPAEDAATGEDIAAE